MILLYAFALYYALACCVKIYEAIEDARGRKQVRAKRVPVGQAPLPQPVPEDACVVTHAEAVSLLSLSLQPEFTVQDGPASPSELNEFNAYIMMQLNGIIAVPRDITLVPERSEGTIIRTRTPQSVRLSPLVPSGARYNQ